MEDRFGEINGLIWNIFCIIFVEFEKIRGRKLQNLITLLYIMLIPRYITNTLIRIYILLIYI
uniref:Uncharacterized protein n=1 Tax=Heterorhabditis bacteriophora TaxID=37862 RepID=A0A1I7WNA2_HETBA